MESKLKNQACVGVGLCLGALLALTGCGARESATTPAAKPSAAGAAAPARRDAPPPLVDTHGLPDFAVLVERYGPAVVNVATVERQTAGRLEIPGLDPDSPMYEFFKRFGFGNGMPHGNLPPARGEGSGFMISSDGYILTNAHVVEGADEVTVRLTDRREFAAKVVGADRRTDVAVLKIDAKELPFVRVGHPESVRVGEWVVAIGSPFGFENSVTAGIVSAKARSLPGDAYTPFIQTDVAVNPGNSGGPLFNLRGEVIGINSQIYSRTGGYQGVSFAIPIDVAVDVKDQLVTHGRVRRGKLGVVIQEVNQTLAESFGLDRPRGALVSSVEKGGPADKAGVKAGDVITGVDGRAVDRSSELPAIVAGIKPGNTVTLEIWRDRASRSIKVKVAELAEEGQARARPASGDAGGRLGLSIRELTDVERRRADTEGHLVVVEAAGPAGAAGVEADDIILGVNGVEVTTVEEFRNAAGRSGKTVALRIQRGDAQIYVPIRIG
jgi:serine protease Do